MPELKPSFFVDVFHYPYKFIYQALSFLYPYGATLNVARPATAVLSTGSVSFPQVKDIDDIDDDANDSDNDDDKDGDKKIVFCRTVLCWPCTSILVNTVGSSLLLAVLPC